MLFVTKANLTDLNENAENIFEISKEQNDEKWKSYKKKIRNESKIKTLNFT